MTEQEIQNLIDMPKTINKKEPKIGYKKQDNDRRGSVSLSAGNDKSIKFHIFIRQNQTFIENFSIGLNCKIPALSNSVSLIRYNGSHDPRDNIQHHLKPHIHRITSEEIQAGYLKHPNKNIQETNKYNTFEEGLIVFFKDMNITNWQEHFYELEQLTLF